MTVSAAKRTAVRQTIASLLRLAHDDARDARTLAEAGGTRNAASLLHSAISRLIEAVVASEQGYAGPPEIRRIDNRNPLKSSLLQLDAFLEAPSTLQRDGSLAEPPAGASVLEPLGLFTATLERFVQHVGVGARWFRSRGHRRAAAARGAPASAARTHSKTAAG
jgi:hypothetical protein